MFLTIEVHNIYSCIVHRMSLIPVEVEKQQECLLGNMMINIAWLLLTNL